MSSPIECDHVQFYVEDMRAATQELTSKYGFTELLSDSAGVTSTCRSTVLGQGAVVVVLTQPLTPGPGREFLAAHGDGLARIGFSCTDIREVCARATGNGAQVIEPPRRFGQVWVAVLHGIGNIVHTLVEQPPNTGTRFLPGIGQVPRGDVGSAMGLRAIDHIAICLGPGQLSSAAEHYEAAWGFERIFAERIKLGAQAMDSAVVASPGRGVVLTLVESAGSRPGQLDDFLYRHGGPGVQHMALRADDITATVGALQDRGVEFVPTPGSYYADLRGRIGLTRHELPQLRRFGILGDRDQDGALYQIFAKSTHPRGTYFTEIIERDGAMTFGSNNVQALFEAKQRELDQSLEIGRVS